jgi:hypothetical protein
VDPGDPVGKSVADAIPPVFEAYSTLEQPLTGDRLTKWEAAAYDRQTVVVDAWERHETALLDILVGRTRRQEWWLGYLETGNSDVVFPDAPRVEMYAHWSYVLVMAGPDQAAKWRTNDIWGESLPDVMFPVDRSWLVHDALGRRLDVYRWSQVSHRRGPGGPRPV